MQLRPHPFHKAATATALAAAVASLLAPSAFDAATSARAAITKSLPPRAQWVRAIPNGREARREKPTRKQLTLIPGFSVPPHIQGRLNVTNLLGGKIYLVRPLEPALTQEIEQGARLYAALKGKPLDVSKAIVAPANAPTLQAAVAEIAKKLPPAETHDIQMSQAGSVKFGPTPALVTQYQTRFKAIDPGAIRQELFGINELVRADLRERQDIVGIGYLGRLQEINFFGIIRQSEGVDMQQARRVAQAAMDQVWLAQLKGVLADAEDHAAKIKVKEGGQQPDEAWNAFCFARLPALDFALQIRAIDVTEPGPKGEFDLWGEGQIVVTMNCFKERVYFLEGVAGSPIQITRLPNGKSGPTQMLRPSNIRTPGTSSTLR